MFELTVLGFNVVLPSLVTLLGAAVALRFTTPAEEPKAAQKSFEFLRGVAIAAATTLAIWGAVALRTEWAVWHDDAWMRLPTGVAVIALAAAVTAGLKNRWLQWGIRAAAVWIAALVMFPTGEAWEFLLPSKTIWLACLWLSTLVGWFLISVRSPREAAVLGLGWILLLIAAAYLTSQSFLKVTEPLMAVASVLGCLSLISLWRAIPTLLAVAAGPCLFASSTAIASAQFNSFLGLPDALSWLAMSSPALAAVLSHWTCSGPETSGSFKRSLWVTLLVCLLLAAAIAGWTQWSLPSGGEDW